MKCERLSKSPPPPRLFIPLILVLGLVVGCGQEQIEPANPASATLVQELGPDAGGKTWVPDEPDGTPFVLPPPHIHNVIECAESVAVQALNNAIVTVKDNGSTLGTGVAYNAIANVQLSRPLVAHEKIIAYQTVNDVTSDKSYPRVVQEYDPNQLPRPQIVEEVWECGKIVTSEGIVAGPQLFLEKDTAGNVVGDAWPTSARNGWWHVNHSALPANSLPAQVRTYQVHCADTSKEIVGPPSPWRDAVLAPYPTPPPQVRMSEFFVGNDTITLDDLLVGASVKVSQTGGFWANGIAIRTANRLVSPYVIEDAAISIEQALCKPSDPVTFTPQPEGDLKKVDPPTILEPLCKDTRVVRVGTTTPGGFIELAHDGQRYLAPNAGALTLIPLPATVQLQNNDVVEVSQIFRGTQNNVQTGVNSATVGASPVLKIHGAESYIDQNTGAPINGFVREESRGPVITFTCCADCTPGDYDQCYTNGERRSFDVNIMMDSGNLEKVTLYEESHGYFRGRWDWYMQVGSVTPWPPSAGREYQVDASNSPCSGSFNELFNVLVGEVDTGDSTAPEVAELTFSLPAGQPPLTVIPGDPPATLEVQPGTATPVSLVGFDPEGMSSVTVDSSPSNMLNGTRTKQSDPNVVPIPAELSVTPSVKPLIPYQEVDISATLSNFNSSTGTVATPVVTVVGKHVPPSSLSLNLASIFSDQEIKILGEHLRYSSLETTLKFEIGSSVYNEPIDPNGDSEEIAIIPSFLGGETGTVNVSITTKNANGVQQFTETVGSFDLRDREGPMEKRDGTEFDFSNTSCSSSNAGTITSVTYTTSTTCPGTNDRWATIMYGANNHTESLCVAPSNMGGSLTFGGGAVFTDSCRNVAFLSHTPGTHKFTLIWYYFPESGAPVHKNVPGVALHYVDSQSALQAVPDLFNAFASRDGTVVVNSTPTTYSGANEVEVSGSMIDMIGGSGFSSAFQPGICATGAPCPISSNLGIQLVDLYVNSAKIGEWSLD